MQKHIALFAMFVMGASTSVKAVESAPAKGDIRVMDELFNDPSIHQNIYILDHFLDFALRCSILPKDSSKQEEVDKFRPRIRFDASLLKDNPVLVQDYLNKLQNLDFKEIIDRILPDKLGGVEKRIVCELAKEIIPLALSKGKTDEGNYFYEKVSTLVSDQSMRQFYRVKKPAVINWKNPIPKYIQIYKNAKILKAQLIRGAFNFANGDTIIQDLLAAPYNIAQEDMDCAFWLHFQDHYHFQDHFHALQLDFNEFCGFFSNKTMKPSIEIVKEVLSHCEKLEDNERLDADLPLRFLRFFIALRSNSEEQEKFDFNAEFKNLLNNVEEYPELGKVLTLIHNDYMTRKFKINQGKYPDQSAFEDFTDARLENDPDFQRSVLPKTLASPWGVTSKKLSKDPAWQSDPAWKSGDMKMPREGLKMIMDFYDPTAGYSHDAFSRMDKDKRKKIMSYTDSTAGYSLDAFSSMDKDKLIKEGEISKGNSEYNNEMQIDTMLLEESKEEEPKDSDVFALDDSLNQKASAQSKKASAQSKTASALDDPMNN